MHFFSQMREELESEENARYDYISEAYGPTARDAALFAEGEEAWYRQEAISRGEWHQMELPLFCSFDAVDCPF